MFDGAEDDGGFRPPAVGVGMFVGFLAEKGAVFFEDFHDPAVGFEDVLANEFFESAVGGEFSVVVDG